MWILIARIAGSAAILVVLVMLGVQHVREPVSRPIVTIEASHDTLDNVVPVYAQFVVTQTLKLQSTGPVTHIEIPMHHPVADSPYRVALHGQQKVGEWELSTEAGGGVVPVMLSIANPQILRGDFELVVDATNISHDDSNSAPALYIQTADDYYPDGNYRIARNEKSGDVALAMFEQVTKRQQLIERWQGSPLSATKEALFALLVLFLAGSVPFVVPTRSS